MFVQKGDSDADEIGCHLFSDHLDGYIVVRCMYRTRNAEGTKQHESLVTAV